MSDAPTQQPPADESRSPDEVRANAAHSLVIVGLRSVAIRGLGLLGTLVIAPLLGPSGYGVLALGVTLLVFGKFLTDGGLVPGLIRRAEPPDEDELRAVVGIQLAVTTSLTAITAGVGTPHGGGGLAVAPLMV